MTPDRTRRWGSLRRIMALAVALAVVSGPLEALIPDTHDGDSHALSMTATDAPAHQDSDASREHAVHVDHCSHGHLIALPHVTTTPSFVRPMSSRRLCADIELVSIEFAPRLRPPIA